MFEREKVIAILVEDDFDDIIDRGSYANLRDILRYGHDGYDEMTDDELIKECEDRDIDIEGLE